MMWGQWKTFDLPHDCATNVQIICHNPALKIHRAIMIDQGWSYLIVIIVDGWPSGWSMLMNLWSKFWSTFIKHNRAIVFLSHLSCLHLVSGYWSLELQWPRTFFDQLRSILTNSDQLHDHLWPDFVKSATTWCMCDFSVTCPCNFPCVFTLVDLAQGTWSPIRTWHHLFRGRSLIITRGATNKW